MPIETSTTPRHVLTVSQENWDLTYEENNWDLTLTYTEGNSMTITNALVNSAIEDNPAATGASLGLGTAAYTNSSAYATSSHTHGNITTDGKIGLNTTANLVVITTTGGALTTASRSGIDTRTSFPNTDVTNATITGAVNQLLRLNSAGNAVVNVLIATEGVEAGEEGGDSGYFRIINTSGDAVTINNANASNAEVSLPTGSGTLALTSSIDGSLSSTDITDFVTAVEAAAPNEVTSATTSDGTASLNVLSVTVSDDDGFIYTSGENATISTSGANAYILTDGAFASIRTTGIDADIFTNGDNANIYTNGADASIVTNGANASIYTVGLNGTIFTLGDSAHIYTSSPTAYIQTSSTFRLFDGTYATTLSHSPTADNAIAFPDRSGSVALTEDYTGGTATIDVLTATVQGTLNAAHIHGNLAGALYAHIRAGENLAKGDPVYVSGYHAGTGYAIVSKADASNAAKMPAIGVMDAAVSNNANGHMVINGTIIDLNTNAYSVNQELYVAAGGGFTVTPPTANSQSVARVERSNTNNGSIVVLIHSSASSGGNGVSDANKLARFSTSGTLPISNIGGLGSNVATFLATPTSANLAAAVTGETGSGGLVFAELPTLTSPTINAGIAGSAVPSLLQNQNGSTRPICVLFEDFVGSTGSGTHPWSDGGTGSTDAISVTGGAGNIMGACRLVTGASSGNSRSRSLGISSSNIFIGAIVRYGFAIPDITTVNVGLGFAGGGSVCYLLYASANNSGQWTLQTNAGVTTFTTQTPQAGNYFSGKRYQLEMERISATQVRILLEIADFNLANWSTVFSGNITHGSVSGNWGECTPAFFVATQTNAARTLTVDWASLHLPMILR